jgi:quercetin dioxygenase-like cupin family protein
MKLIRSLLIGVAAALVISCGTPPPEDTLAEKLGEVMEEAPEPPALDMVAPEAATTIDRNQYVSVVHVDLEAGSSVPGHEAPVSAVYFLTEAALQTTSDDDGDTASYSAGEAAVWDAGTYGVENVGESAAEMIVVARSAEALPEALESPSDEAPTDVAPLPPETLLSGDDFIIQTVAVEAGQERSLRFEYPCSVYTLTPAQLLVPRGDDEVETMDVFEDRAVWFDWQSEFTVRSNDDATRLVVFQVVR